jgi:hypothetical protein
MNFIADEASRRLIDENDYSLDLCTYKSIVTRFGTPEIDLFASHRTAKCKNFYSWFPDPESSGVDAFSFKWNSYFYAFPPFNLIPRVLKKVAEDYARGIIVVPDWKNQAWFPCLMKMKICDALWFKKGSFSSFCPYENKDHPLSKDLTLFATVISGVK